MWGQFIVNIEEIKTCAMLILRSAIGAISPALNAAEFALDNQKFYANISSPQIQ